MLPYHPAPTTVNRFPELEQQLFTGAPFSHFEAEMGFFMGPPGPGAWDNIPDPPPPFWTALPSPNLEVENTAVNSLTAYKCVEANYKLITNTY